MAFKGWPVPCLWGGGLAGSLIALLAFRQSRIKRCLTCSNDNRNCNFSFGSQENNCGRLNKLNCNAIDCKDEYRHMARTQRRFSLLNSVAHRKAVALRQMSLKRWRNSLGNHSQNTTLSFNKHSSKSSWHPHTLSSPGPIAHASDDDPSRNTEVHLGNRVIPFKFLHILNPKWISESYLANKLGTTNHNFNLLSSVFKHSTGNQLLDASGPIDRTRASVGLLWHKSMASWAFLIESNKQRQQQQQHSCDGGVAFPICGACHKCVKMNEVVRKNIQFLSNRLDTCTPQVLSASSSEGMEIDIIQKLFYPIRYIIRMSLSVFAFSISGMSHSKLFFGKADEAVIEPTFVYPSTSDDRVVDQTAEIQKWVTFLNNCQSFGKWSIGNKVKIFDKNNDAFEDMWNAIDNSKEYVWLETYIFDCSPVARRMAAHLCRAAERGCDVIAIIDYIGTMPLRNKLILKMQEAGVKVVLFNQPLPREKSIGPIAFRDHRKILIADNIGHVGSINISADDAELPYGNGKYYDLQMRVEGPAVSHLASVFIDSLNESQSGFIRQVPPATPPLPDGVYVQILESNVRRHVRSIQRVLQHIVRRASRSICITQSYFITPGFLKKALLSACYRGVKVSALLSGVSDVIGDVEATLHLIPRFLVGKRTRFFLMHSQHCHAKCSVVDGLWTSIGSFNWDRLSSRRNLEVVATVFDAKFAEDVELLHRNKTNAAEISREFLHRDVLSRGVFQRWRYRIAYFLVKFGGTPLFDGFDRGDFKANKDAKFDILIKE